MLLSGHLWVSHAFKSESNVQLYSTQQQHVCEVSFVTCGLVPTGAGESGKSTIVKQMK